MKTFFELIKEQLELLFSSKQKRLAAMVVLIIELISITPLCGVLFQCGCDWPWLGLDANCNFHQSNIKQQCPWCVSMVTGVLSTSLAIVAGLFSSRLSIIRLSNQQGNKEILTRVLVGISAFFLMAIITATLAALWQGHPLPMDFLFKDLLIK